MSDGKQYPWVKSLDDNLWHKRPVTDDPSPGGDYRTVCGLTVGSVHVSEVPPKEIRQSYGSSREFGCRKCGWLESKEGLIELMAKNAHEAWMATNRSWGINSRLADWGEEFMVAYEDLSEKGKDLDRTIMRAILMSLSDSGYHLLRKR